MKIKKEPLVKTWTDKVLIQSSKFSWCDEFVQIQIALKP